ncbi:MAG: phospholipase [Sphingobacterium sp.]|jgi:predicted peptidase|uniref:carboxylesterase family protein n=1 Tax=unclassified Sphingobacterium TaxID=2609468 RepID=UPI00283EFFCB|nr:phospholipase [Sphingobacterium sp.]MDR3006956.1 phospholipase [Sphingobacterium sp.]
MRQKKIRFFLQIGVLFLIITCNFCSAQQCEFDNRSIDSTTFAETRTALNQLSVDQFEKRVFTNEFATIPYRFLLPKNFNPKKKYPLVITFHNSSRIGTDNENQLEHLARTWVRGDIYAKFNCFVIAPQFEKRSSNYEPNQDDILIAKPSRDAQQILGLIDNIETEYPNIDINRIYLIGYSMGASTTQNLMRLAPDKFAAMISIAAVPDLSNLNAFKRKNIWLIHGEKDSENPYVGSKILYEKLQGNHRLKFTTFKNLQHNNIVIPFLLTDELHKWLFTKHR